MKRIFVKRWPLDKHDPLNNLIPLLPYIRQLGISYTLFMLQPDLYPRAENSEWHQPTAYESFCQDMSELLEGTDHSMNSRLTQHQ